DNEVTWRTLDAVHAIAEETGHSPAQVSLRWVMQRPGVTAPIIGARNLEQLRDNLGAAGWSLTSEQMDRLTTASAQRLPYPHDVLARFVRR
ncbi:MAG TPA: aldo/keto reductase, partial [Actinopolymorphaceae bacterium]